MIRVDHAGERGADVIYNGQWDVLKDTDSGDLIKVGKFFEPTLELEPRRRSGSKILTSLIDF